MEKKNLFESSSSFLFNVALNVYLKGFFEGFNVQSEKEGFFCRA